MSLSRPVRVGKNHDFLACDCEAVTHAIVIDFLSVCLSDCPSVRLSNAYIVTKRKHLAKKSWTRKRAIAKALQLKGHPDLRQSIWHIISIFCFFLFENIAFWEGPCGNYKCRSRDATPLVNNKLESVQLQKHCISNAERHCFRRCGFIGLVWCENIVFGRFAKCA